VAGVLSKFRVLVAPGLHGSGPEHWQSRWQRLYPSFERVEQDHWDQPDLAGWSARVSRVRQRDRRPALIVAHSFGTLATVHSVARDPAHVAGVLLVAPADPDKFGVAAQLPVTRLPCPSILLASSNDPWMTAGHAALWAGRWGSEYINLGALGHINAESGLGDWLVGQRLLQKLAEQAHNEQIVNIF
jgi:predicted alpha/beta hydrolase family esterase